MKGGNDMSVVEVIKKITEVVQELGNFFKAISNTSSDLVIALFGLATVLEIIREKILKKK